MNYTQKLLFLVLLVLLAVNYNIILDGDLPVMAYPDENPGSFMPGDNNNPVNADTELYNDMMAQASKQWGVGGDSIQTFMDQIAKHESKGIATQKQISERQNKETGAWEQYDGPGRGLYQFETEDGSGAGNVAMSRLRNMMSDYTGEKDTAGKAGKLGKLFKAGREMPEWMSDFKGDASDLSAEQQNIMFLANYMEHPTARIDSTTLGSDQGRKDFYSNMHHAGAEEGREEMGNKFAKSQNWKVDGQYEGAKRALPIENRRNGDGNFDPIDGIPGDNYREGVNNAYN